MSVERTTRQCTFNELDPGLRQVLQKYFLAHGLGDPETETRLCCETLTVRHPSAKWISFLEGNLDATSRRAILLTPVWLVWALSGDKSGAVATGARLRLLRARAKVTWRSKESRLELAGFMEDTTEYVRGRFELGSQPEAKKFSEAVSTAILDINTPPQKPRRRWFGF